MTRSERLFTRKYNDLRFLTFNFSEYNILRASAIIRHLFLDSNPLYTAVNRKYRLQVSFRIYGPRTIIFSLGTHHQYRNAKDNDRGQFVNELNLRNFLKFPFLENNGKRITIRETIKYLANDSGGVHFERLDKSIKDKFDGIQYGVVLRAFYEITQAILSGLEPLKKEIVIYPTNLSLIGDYVIPSGNIHFKGKGQFMETRNINSRLNNGFGLLTELYILPQANDGRRIIYHIGGENCFNFRIEIQDDRYLIFNATINSKKKIIFQIDRNRFNFFEEWLSYCVFIDFNDTNHSCFMSVYVNNKQISLNEVSYHSRKQEIKEATIGSDLKGKRTASFRLVNLMVLNDTTTPEQRTGLLNYFEGMWKR